MPPTNGHGLLRVYLAYVEGRQVTIRYARPGDVLGIAVLVGGPPRSLPPSAGGSVAKLKELLETGRVRLQNGRVETV